MEELTQRTQIRPDGQRKQIERATYNLPEAAALLGVGRTLAFELARRGAFPTPVIRLGRRLVVSKSAIERLLADGSL